MPANNTAAKRLTETDAKAIFSSLANNEQPPDGLDFRIIKVPQNGLKLSPPSLEFDDGLYVLLRDKLTRVPSELSDKLLSKSELECMRSCPWSLSGPQYPKQKMIQQRYCYPRGNPKYSEGKGGAIWTRIHLDGKEDIDSRILHVYHSNKRAGTSGKPKSQAITKSASQAVSPRHSKRKNAGGSQENRKKKGPNNDLQKALECPSLLQGVFLKSPSYEFDESLDLTSENLGSSSFDQSPNNFSFMPVKSQDIEDMDKFQEMVKWNPAFNSAVRPQQHIPCPSNGHYHEQYARYHPHAYGGRYGDWFRTAPSIPQLTTSEQKKNDAENQQEILNVNDFSKRLSDMEDRLLADIHGSSSFDQALKLHLLRNWASALAQRPLQPREEPALAQEANATTTQVKIKMESPGTPNITP